VPDFSISADYSTALYACQIAFKQFQQNGICHLCNSCYAWPKFLATRLVVVKAVGFFVCLVATRREMVGIPMPGGRALGYPTYGVSRRKLGEVFDDG
jgi:hypothetical protein